MEERRKLQRLKGWDYSADGWYFLTFCTHEHKPLFGRVVSGVEHAVPATRMELGPFGILCEQAIAEASERDAHVSVDAHIVMPNHVHLVVSVRNARGKDGGQSPISQTVGFVKSHVTKGIKEAIYCTRVWQRGYYDHIIRNEADYLRILEYVQTNPQKWAEDRFNI